MSTGPAVVPHARDVTTDAPKQLLVPVLALYREIPLFEQRCNARDIENSKPAGHRRMTDVLSVFNGQISRSSGVHCPILPVCLEKCTRRSVNFTRLK